MLRAAMRAPHVTAIVLGAAFAVAGVLPAPAQTATADKPAETAQAAPSEDTVVARVGDSEITERDLAFAAADLGQQFAQVPEEMRKAAVLNALIDIKLLARQAEQEKLDEDATFQARMKFLRERALHNTLFQEKVVEQIADEEVKQRYEQEVAAMPPQEEVKARHILVKTNEEAQKVIEELEAGKDFAELAKEKTIDPSGTSSGGDLGYFSKGQMVPAFEEAAFALEKGQYTKAPVETQFGFHVILKEDQRNVPPPPFEDVEAQVRQIVMRDRYAKLVEENRKAAEVNILDEKLKSQLEAVKAGQ